MESCSLVKISYYPTIYNTVSKDHITIADFLDLLKTGEHITQVLKIRELKAQGKPKSTIKAHKEKLPVVTLSGTFSPRQDAHIIQHSGFLCLDFDGFSSQFEVDEVKARISKDKYVYASFLSASGNLAVLIRIDPTSHREVFKCADRYFLTNYGIAADKAAVNESRNRYLTYDPEYYLNESAELFPVDNDYLETVEYDRPDTSGFTGQSNSSDFVKLIELIERDGIDLTSRYEDWVRIGYGIAGNFSLKGLDYFKRLSVFNEGYNEVSAERQYFSIVKKIEGSSLPERKATLKTIFYLADLQGIRVTKRKDRNTNPQFALVTGAEKVDALTKFEYLQYLIKGKYSVRLNSLTRRIEIDGQQMDDFKLNEIWNFVAQKSDGKEPKIQILKAAINVNIWPEYHPIKEYFENLPAWDTQDRISEMVSFMSAEKPLYAMSYLSKWLTGVVHCLYGTPNPLILILVGPQNTGKTEFFRRLFPKELATEYFAESHLHEKHRINNMNNNLIVFDDEMQGMKKMGIEELKSLTSQSKFAETRKYEAYETKLDRIASLCAASNTFEILADDQNRRFLPIHINGKMDWEEMEKIDRGQLMAQIYHNYNTGFNWQITSFEMDVLEVYGNEFSRFTHEDELIAKYCERPVMPYMVAINGAKHLVPTVGTRFLSATEILEKILVASSVKNLNKTNIGRALRRAKYDQISKRRGGVSLKLWVVKLLDTDKEPVFDPEEAP